MTKGVSSRRTAARGHATPTCPAQTAKCWWLLKIEIIACVLKACGTIAHALFLFLVTTSISLSVQGIWDCMPSRRLWQHTPLVWPRYSAKMEDRMNANTLYLIHNYHSHTHTHTHKQVVIVIAQARGSSDGLEDALFWGIRFSVIAIALNPLLYGILARQYRLAYWYVIKLVLSKCCRCISPPLKDVFGKYSCTGM